MRPAASKPAACMRPLPEPRPKSSLFPGKHGQDARATANGPRHIGSVLDEILRAPGGLAGEAARLVAKGGVL